MIPSVIIDVYGYNRSGQISTQFSFVLDLGNL